MVKSWCGWTFSSLILRFFSTSPPFFSSFSFSLFGFFVSKFFQTIVSRECQLVELFPFLLVDHEILSGIFFIRKRDFVIRWCLNLSVEFRFYSFVRRGNDASWNFNIFHYMNLPRSLMNKLKCWNSIELRNIFLENVNEIIFVNLSSKEKRFLY